MGVELPFTVDEPGDHKVTLIADHPRAFDDIDLGPEVPFADVELDLADKLIDQLAMEEFDVDICFSGHVHDY